MGTTRTALLFALLAAAGTACSGDELRTGIKIQLTGDAPAIRAEADRKAAEMLADAEEAAARVEASANETAARLYAEAFARDPALYLHLRELEAFEAIIGEDDTLILESDSALFRRALGSRP
jgi:regulator of protease activity HflC (stomatin/prohibitin superfamily)